LATTSHAFLSFGFFIDPEIETDTEKAGPILHGHAMATGYRIIVALARNILPHFFPWLFAT